MECSKCGAKISSSDMFCPNCGAPTGVPGADPVPKKEEKKIGKNKILLAAVGGAVLLAAVIVCVVMLFRTKTINLEEMIKVNFTGYNTAGKAEAVLDDEKFMSALSEVLDEKKTSLEEFSDCYNAVRLSVTNSGGLSNGDKVTVKISYDNDRIKEYGLKFKGESVEFTVTGLEDLTEFDPFQNLTVSFTGISPNGQIEYSYSGQYISTMNFHCDKTSGLRNGDSVAVSVAGYEEETAKEQGYKLTQSSKTYTVEGLQEYVESYSDLPEDFISKVRKETEDIIHSYVAQDYNDKNSLGTIEYSGYVFNTAKPETDAYDAYNELYIIYRGTVSNSERDFQDTMVYYPICFENILSAEGTVNFESCSGVIGYSDLGDGWYGTSGYTNPLTAYTELVVSNQNNYVCAAGDGFEKYSEYTPISALADIKEENLQSLTEEAEDMVAAYIAEKASDIQASDIALEGEYLLLAKNQGEDYVNNNRLVVVMSAVVSSVRNRFSPVTVYYPIQYDGIINLPGDEFMYVKDEGIQGGFNFPDSIVYSEGYIDGESMFNDIVTANRDQYTYEVSEGLKKFGE